MGCPEVSGQAFAHTSLPLPPLSMTANSKVLLIGVALEPQLDFFIPLATCNLFGIWNLELTSPPPQYKSGDTQ